MGKGRPAAKHIVAAPYSLNDIRHLFMKSKKQKGKHHTCVHTNARQPQTVTIEKEQWPSLQKQRRRRRRDAHMAAARRKISPGVFFLFIRVCIFVELIWHAS